MPSLDENANIPGITLDEVENMSFNDVMNHFGISDNQGTDSELDGFSDADDGFPEKTTPSVMRNKRRRGSSDEELVASNTSSGVSDTGSAVEDEINDEPIIRPPIPLQDDEDESDPEEPVEDDDQYTPLFHQGIGGRRICEKYQKCNFQQPFGPKVPVNVNQIVNIFFLFFTEQLFDLVIYQSNLYATQKGHRLDLTKEECKRFLGILIVMGFHQLPSLRLYWSTHRFYNLPAITNIMSLRRFITILRYLHLNDNSKMPPRGTQEFDRLYKIRPWLNHFNQTFQMIFDPSQFLSVDESMIAFKGRSTLKQYMPMKPIKRGFKVWAICCSITGYLLGFEFYEGKKGQRTMNLGEEVVLSLTNPFKNLGYCIFFDRFFSSFALVKKLLMRGLYACATILQTKKFFPHNILKADRQLKYGEFDSCYTNDFGLVKWKDRGAKCVTVVSSIDDPCRTTVIQRRNKLGQKIDVCCPDPIVSYNKFMGGVDLFDQYMSYYSTQWKSRRWWMKAFYYFLDASIVNSYILYKEEVKKMKNKKAISQLAFRLCLAEELIGDFKSKTTPLRKVIVTRKKFTCKRRRLEVIMPQGHLPTKGKLRRCAHCSTKAKPVKSSVVCQDCGVALCIKNCFKDFHENLI